MGGQDDLDRQVKRREKALRRKLGRRRGRAEDFDTLLARAERDLPRGARRDGERIRLARAQMAHPKLAARMDPRALSGAFRRLDGAIGGIDPVRRRRVARINALAGYLFNLLVFIGLLVAFLTWHG